jgi:hypothetical protein
MLMNRSVPTDSLRPHGHLSGADGCRNPKQAAKQTDSMDRVWSVKIDHTVECAAGVRVNKLHFKSDRFGEEF